jgi:hypothetical protein
MLDYDGKLTMLGGMNLDEDFEVNYGRTGMKSMQ